MKSGVSFARIVRHSVPSSVGRVGALLLVLLALAAGFDASAAQSYLGVATVFETNDCWVFRLNPDGGISLVDLLWVEWDPCEIGGSDAGEVFHVSRCRMDEEPPAPILSVFRVSNIETVTEAETHVGVQSFENSAGFSPYAKYQILWDGDQFKFQVWEVTDSHGLAFTGNSFEEMGFDVLGFSRPTGFLFVYDCHNQLLYPHRIAKDGSVTYTGTSLDTGVYGCTRVDYHVSPDGNTCIIPMTGYPNIGVLNIRGDETIEVTQYLHTPLANNPTDGAFTPDSRCYVGAYFDYYTNVQSFRVNDDSTLTSMTVLVGMDGGEQLAITPDGNWAVFGGRPTMTTTSMFPIRIHHDATLECLWDKEFVYPGYFSQIRFIPPQVLSEYAAEGLLAELNAPRPAGARMAESLDEFTSGSAPVQFDTPRFDRESSGTLVLSPTSANCFGFWQSPVDANMVVPYSLYRARYDVERLDAGSGMRESGSAKLETGSGMRENAVREVSSRLSSPASRLPSLRLRANAQTFQQTDCLYITDPARFLSPLASSLPPLFFEPPMSSVSREEELDDVFCALDLMSFDPAADLETSYVLKSLVVDRIPTDELEWTTPTLVREYKFDTSPEGWSLAGAPEFFTMPDGSYDPTSGTLILRATNNTNCFGYWHSNPDDIVTSTCGELYRATFEIHTDITDRTKVPEIRFRINTEDGMLAATQSIESNIDSEMSPYFDPARPGHTFTHNVYLWKPPASYQDKLILSCDLLNFAPDDSPNGAIILDSARVTKHSLPKFPIDRDE